MVSFNKIIALAAVTSVMTACTIAPVTPRPYQETSWQKEGISKSETNDKIGHCKTEVGYNNLPQEQARKLATYCMKADGYKLVTETKYR